MKLYASILHERLTVKHELATGRHAWIQLISGGLDVNGTTLNAGDGAAISEETALKISAYADNSDFLLFDLN